MSKYAIIDAADRMAFRKGDDSVILGIHEEEDVDCALSERGGESGGYGDFLAVPIDPERARAFMDACE